MLLSLKIKNWLSFKDDIIFETFPVLDKEPDSLSLDENFYKNQIYNLKNYDTKSLPVSVIFGPNASGKSNIYKALKFIKQFILEPGDRYSKIPVKPYAFSKSSREAPSEFSIAIYTIDETSVIKNYKHVTNAEKDDDDIQLEGGSIYYLKFAVTRDAVISETLIKAIDGEGVTLYTRENGKIEFPGITDQNTKQKLQNIFEYTRVNQLFLQAVSILNNDTFIEVNNWFQFNLHLIDPKVIFARIKTYTDENNPLYLEINDLLAKLDTNIDSFKVIKLPGRVSLFSDPLTNSMTLMSLAKGQFVRAIDTDENSYFVTKENDGSLSSYQVITFHKTQDGDEITFDLTQESEGVQRLFDILPVFAKNTDLKNNSVFVVDELDRSLHPLLTQKLVENFLKNIDCSHISQLIFTAHTDLLIDKAKIRTDELWITEKDFYKGSRLGRFTDYKEMASDDDPRLSYLDGRLGGIPILQDILW